MEDRGELRKVKSSDELNSLEGEEDADEEGKGVKAGTKAAPKATIKKEKYFYEFIINKINVIAININ